MQIARFPFQSFDAGALAEEAARATSAVPQTQPEETSPEEGFVPLPQQVAMTQEELAQKEAFAHAQGAAEGYAKGLAEGKGEHAALEQQVADQLRQMTIAIASVENMYKEAEGEFREAIKQLSGALALKIAGKALADKPEEAILQTLEQLLPNLIRQPELRIEVHPDLADRLQEKIIRLSSEMAFPGTIAVVASAEVATGDCRVEWASGRAVLNQAVLQQKLRELLGMEG